MNEMRQKISRIVDELMIFQFNNGAEDIQINLRRQKDGIEILFGSVCPGHGHGDMEKQVERLNRYLKVERNEAMEAYFWGLAGEDEGCDNAELQLIGQMVDQAEARLEGDKLSIRLFRRFGR